MKVNAKILIICILIIILSIPVTYAYWTDTVNSRINMSIAYDAYLNVSGVPEPIMPIVPLIPAVETLPVLTEGEGTVIEGADGGELPPQDEPQPEEELPPQDEQPPQTSAEGSPLCRRHHPQTFEK